MSAHDRGERSRVEQACVLAAAVSVAAAASAAAATFYVNSPLDQPDADGLDGLCRSAANWCTLRAAVMQANRSAESATILLPAGVFLLTRPPDPQNFDDSGDLNIIGGIAARIDIVGAGQELTVVDAGGLDRAFHVEGLWASFTDLTIRGGDPVVATGGGVYFESGDGELLRVTVRDCAASGVSLVGTGFPETSVELRQVTLRDNSSAGHGGGLKIIGYEVELFDSAVYGNHASHGGGISLSSNSSLRLLGSSISSNRADRHGGGVYVASNPDDSVVVWNSTIVFNQADSDFDDDGDAGGIAVVGGLVYLHNSLLGGNYVTTQQNPDDCFGTIRSYGRNLFGDVAGCSVVTGSGSWGLVNDMGYIGPLQNNGGPTKSHALHLGSNAIEGGDPDLGCLGPAGLIPFDQRGAPRIWYSSCDIGAYEFGPLYSDGFESGGLSTWTP